MTRIKICGLTNSADARAAAELGADYLGFVFYEPSPRGLTLGEAVHVMRALPDDVPRVGVFVNHSPAFVRTAVRELGLTAVQLHGEEDPADFLDPPCRLWRAIKFVDDRPVPDPAAWPVERFVIDANVPGAYGGTGVAADWVAAARFAAGLPAMLAGGLNEGNVAAAIRAVHPVGVDVSSGIEAEPGRKDHARMRDFFSNVRSLRE